MPTQKMWREEREEERQRVQLHTGERPPLPLAPLFICFFPPPVPTLCKLGHPGALFVPPEDLSPVLGPAFVLFLQAFSFLVFSVQPLSCIWLFVTPWIAAHQPSLSITKCQSPPKPMSIKSMMPPNYPILCHPLLLLPSIFPSIGVFSNESALHVRWPKYWSFSFSISLSNE